jgi:hypothetical protein
MGRQAKAQHLPERHRRPPPPRAARKAMRASRVAFGVACGGRTTLLAAGARPPFPLWSIFAFFCRRPSIHGRRYGTAAASTEHEPTRRGNATGSQAPPFPSARPAGRINGFPSFLRRRWRADVRRSSDTTSLPLWPFRRTAHEIRGENARAAAARPQGFRAVGKGAGQCGGRGARAFSRSRSLLANRKLQPCRRGH